MPNEQSPRPHFSIRSVWLRSLFIMLGIVLSLVILFSIGQIAQNREPMAPPIVTPEPYPMPGPVYDPLSPEPRPIDIYEP